MKIRDFIAVAVTLILLPGLSSQVNAASFEVVEENGGPLCWIKVRVSQTVSISLFTEKGGQSEEISLLIEDDKMNAETFERLGERFDISVHFKDGDRIPFIGFFDETMAAPVADVELRKLRKLVDQSEWQISIGEMPAVAAEDVITDALYKKFITCAKR